MTIIFMITLAIAMLYFFAKNTTKKVGDSQAVITKMSSSCS